MSSNRLLVGLALVIFIIGFAFLRGPVPHIVIAPEVIVDTNVSESWLIKPDITNTMISSWLVTAVLIILVVVVTRGWKLVPTGVQNVVEGALEAFYNLVTGIAGEENGRRFFPVVATIFIFVLASNWLSLLPVFNVIGVVHEEEHGFVMEQTSVGGFDIGYTPFSSVPSQWSPDTIEEDDPEHHEKLEQAHEDGKIVGELFPILRGPNTDINTPLALAIISAIAVESWAIASLGFFSYGSKFINFRGPIDFFVGFLELISELVRLVSFTFRLFGNMFAGEVVIVMFIFLAPGSIPIILYGLEMFVGIIQAFIFSMLTLVFAVMAVAHHGNGHEEHKKENEGAHEGHAAQAAS